MNGPSVPISVNVPAKEVPMEDLRAAKEKIEAEEPADSAEDTNSSNSKRKSSAESMAEQKSSEDTSEEKSSESKHEKKTAEATPERVESSRTDSTESSTEMEGTVIRRDHENVDEITVSPVQERFPGRDIRFGELPHPRKHERDLSEGTHLLFLSRLTGAALRNESAIDDSVEEPEGRRGITIEEGPSRRNSFLRLRTAASTGFQRAATFEKVLSNAFRRRRDGSPSSRRSTQTTMTLPYFTFAPTVGRNSVPSRRIRS